MTIPVLDLPRSATGPAATVSLPGPEEFYAQLTARNLGLIPVEEQQRLRQTSILIAGCGSIGGAVVEPLIRLGAEHLVLAEPDVYEMHNLNRQHARLRDIGRNKATVLKSWAHEVNPYAKVRVCPNGITTDNVAALTGEAALVFDGIDVTNSLALGFKYFLHLHAKRAGVPVVSGYDIAGVQFVHVYDYRQRKTKVLDGRIAADEVTAMDPLRFLAHVVPLRALPIEIFPELERRKGGSAESFPQLIYSAQMFGVLAPRLALDLLAGRSIRRQIIVDVHDLPRPSWLRLRTSLCRIAGLARLIQAVLAYRQ